MVLIKNFFGSTLIMQVYIDTRTLFNYVIQWWL